MKKTEEVLTTSCGIVCRQFRGGGRISSAGARCASDARDRRKKAEDVLPPSAAEFGGRCGGGGAPRPPARRDPGARAASGDEGVRRHNFIMGYIVVETFIAAPRERVF